MESGEGEVRKPQRANIHIHTSTDTHTHKNTHTHTTQTYTYESTLIHSHILAQTITSHNSQPTHTYSFSVTHANIRQNAQMFCPYMSLWHAWQSYAQPFRIQWQGRHSLQSLLGLSLSKVSLSILCRSLSLSLSPCFSIPPYLFYSLSFPITFSFLTLCFIAPYHNVLALFCSSFLSLYLSLSLSYSPSAHSPSLPPVSQSDSDWQSDRHLVNCVFATV